MSTIYLLINVIISFKIINSFNVQNLNEENSLRTLSDCDRRVSQCIDSLIDAKITELESNIPSSLTNKQLTEDTNFTISLWKYPYEEGTTIPDSVTKFDFGSNCGLTGNYILMVIEYFNFTSPTNFIYFKLYETNGASKSITCSGNITIYTPIDSTQSKSNMTNIELLSIDGVNVFDYEDDFFQNACNNQNVSDRDYTLNDRRKFFYIDYNFCQEYCFLVNGLESLDFKTNKGICTCKLEAFNRNLKAKIVVSDSSKDDSDLLDEMIPDIDIGVDIPGKEMLSGFTDFSVGNIGDKFAKTFNYRVVTCVKLLSKWNNYKENIGFWVSSAVFILLIVLFVLYITVSETQLMGRIEKVVNNNKKNDVPNPANPNPKGDNSDDIPEIMSANNSDNQGKDPNLAPGNTNLEDNKEGIIVPKEDNPNEKPPEGDQGEKIEIKMYKDDRIFKYLNMTFTQVIENDKRNPFLMIWDTFVVKVRLMNVIFIPQAFGVITMEISILLFSIIMDFTFNAFLFGDDTISKISDGGGKLDFFTSWIISLISGIISRFLTRYVVGLTDYKEMLIFFLLESTTSSRARKFLKEYIQKVKKNLRLYLILELVLMVFYIFYLTLFGALYKNSQNALFLSYFRGLVTYIIYTLVLILVIVVLRVISIKSKQKYVYYTSRFILQKV